MDVRYERFDMSEICWSTMWRWKSEFTRLRSFTNMPYFCGWNSSQI